MARVKEHRITVDSLHGLSRLLFTKDVHSGAQLARLLHVGPNTLWSYFNRHGLKPEDGVRVADVLDQWAIRLMEHSRALRRQATAVARSAPVARDSAGATESRPRRRRRQNGDQTAPIPATQPVPSPEGAEV